MGLMDSWKNWSQWLWDREGSKLQAQYDTIATWKLPPSINNILGEISKKLPAALVALLLSYIQAIYNEYGPEAVATIITANANKLETIIAKKIGG